MNQHPLIREPDPPKRRSDAGRVDVVHHHVVEFGEEAGNGREVAGFQGFHVFEEFGYVAGEETLAAAEAEGEVHVDL